MNRNQLVESICLHQSYLCIGLDTDISKIPKTLWDHADPVFEFNRRIIDATKNCCVAYKINTAFYEVLGLRGWEALAKTADYVPKSHLKIADAKRGDIGNTSAQYAKAFFETLDFDAITVAPYMGEDSLRPFLEYKDKWTIILALTSNAGARDFQFLEFGQQYLFEKVVETAVKWGSPSNTMFVVGATQSSQLERMRRIAAEHFFLVPGVGAQGGDLKEISEKAMIDDCGILLNVSRDVIYASDQGDFEQKAADKSKFYQQQMKHHLQYRGKHLAS